MCMDLIHEVNDFEAKSEGTGYKVFVEQRGDFVKSPIQRWFSWREGVEVEGARESMFGVYVFLDKRAAEKYRRTLFVGGYSHLVIRKVYWRGLLALGIDGGGRLGIGTGEPTITVRFCKILPKEKEER